MVNLLTLFNHNCRLIFRNKLKDNKSYYTVKSEIHFVAVFSYLLTPLMLPSMSLHSSIISYGKQYGPLSILTADLSIKKPTTTKYPKVDMH